MSETTDTIGQIKAVVSKEEIPVGWYTCDGRSVSKNDFPDLFAIIGYTYGGSGDDFLLPDLVGRVPIGATCTVDKATNTITTNNIGQAGGNDVLLLTKDHLPMPEVAHDLKLTVAKGSTVNPKLSAAATGSTDPSGNYPLQSSAAGAWFADAAAATESMATSDVEITGTATLEGDLMFSCPGKGLNVNNVQPSLSLKYVICVKGNPPVAGTRMKGMIGEVTLWGGTGQIPDGWVLCDGSPLSSNTYHPLYAIIGTNFGGSGIDFRVPDMQGKAPFGVNPTGGKGTPDRVGRTMGRNSYTLTPANLPASSFSVFNTLSIGDPLQLNHKPRCGTEGSTDSPEDAYVAAHENTSVGVFGADSSSTQTMAASTVNYVGDVTLAGSIKQPQSAATALDLRQKFLTLPYLICVSGQMPIREPGSGSVPRNWKVPPSRTVGEVAIWAGSWKEAPYGWRFCDGRQYPGAIAAVLWNFFAPKAVRDKGTAEGVGTVPDLYQRVPRGATMQRRSRHQRGFHWFDYIARVNDPTGAPVTKLNEAHLPSFEENLSELSIDHSGFSASVTPACSANSGATASPAGKYYSQLAVDAGDDWADPADADAFMGSTPIDFDMSLDGTAWVNGADEWKGVPYDNHMECVGFHFLICMDAGERRRSDRRLT